MDFSSLVLFILLVKSHTSELDRWGSLFKGWGQINVFWDNASIQKANHTFVNVFFRNRRWILEILLLLEIFLMAYISHLPGFHDWAQGFLGLVRSIFVLVGSCWLENASSFGFEEVVWTKQISNILWLCLKGKQ